MDKEIMRNEIIKVATDNYIDEVRFIDAGALTEEFLGVPEKFEGRQPTDIMPEAKTIILASVYIGKFASPYGENYGRTSRLVFSGFYHNIVENLLPVKGYLEEQGYKAVVMDEKTGGPTIPLKGAAVKAGLGWIGKNTLLNSRKYGTFRALGAILTDADIHEKYEVAENRCGKCRRCIDVCPVSAFEGERRIIRKKCLSYIFGKEQAELPQKVDSKGYFFECEICQNVCPWNQPHIKEPLDTSYGRTFGGRDLRPDFKVESLTDMDEDTYYEKIAPLLAGDASLSYELFKRNVHAVFEK